MPKLNLPLPRRRWLLLPGLATVVIIGGILTSVYLILAPYRDLDVLITNGTVIDGSGAPPQVGDIGIRDRRIVGISRWRFFLSHAKVIIDARGLIVAPGFIDVHTHVEPNIPAAESFHADNFLRQGITTLITGNCGRSRTDVSALFSGLQRNGSYVNVATLVGHNSIRKQVMAFASRKPTPEELTAMRNLVNRAMKEGALGFSTGLEYVPGRFAEEFEVVALARVAADDGGIYATHIRDEGPKGIVAIREALEIGRKSGAAIEISHFKSSGPRQWRTIEERLNLLNEARAHGQTVSIDVYPYTSSSTTTDVLLPEWALRDNRSGLRQAVGSSEARRKLYADIAARLNNEGWKDLSFVRIAAGRPEWIGKTLMQSPTPAQDVNQGIENLIEISLRGGAQAVYANMNESDVEQVVRYSYSVFGSDSAVRDPTVQYLPHPRGSGTFPRVFRLYVREKRLLSMAEAIHKASGQPAKIFRLRDRGLIRPGYWADIVIFDGNKIEDKSDYDRPFDEPRGINYVIVNGSVAVDHGALTGRPPAGMPATKQE